ncbi:MAG: NFACT family protein, partial [Planctomycetota bacterium]
MRIPGLAGGHIGELVAELAPLVAGSLVRELLPLPPRDLLLVLAPPAGAAGEKVRRLRLSAGPLAARLHLQIGRVRRHTGPVDPFFARAAECLVGARIAALLQVEGDRVVRLEVAGPAGPRALVIELLGRHGNLVLLDGSLRVLDLLVPPRGAAAAAPRLAAGAPYALPPGREGGT